MANHLQYSGELQLHFQPYVLGRVLLSVVVSLLIAKLSVCDRMKCSMQSIFCSVPEMQLACERAHLLSWSVLAVCAPVRFIQDAQKN